MANVAELMEQWHENLKWTMQGYIGNRLLARSTFNVVLDEEDREYLRWLLDECHYQDLRIVPGGRVLFVKRLFAHYSLTLTAMHDKTGYLDQWCYTGDVRDVRKALMSWSGEPGTEPTGWHRHPESGRRREGGDPAKEEVRY